MISHHINSYKIKIFFFGIASILIGVIYYFVFRDHSSLLMARFFPFDRLLLNYSFRYNLPWTNGILNSLPTFIHAFSFSLFTALVTDLTNRSIFYSCITWAAVDICFEIVQIIKIPDCPENPLSSIACNYVANGVFDWNDLYSIILGSLLAWVTLKHVSQPPGE